VECFGISLLKIRPWKDSDNPQIVALITTVLKQEFPQDQAAYPAEDLKDLAKTYGGVNDLFLVAEDESQVIGTCGIKADGGETAILRRLFVSSAHRGKGVGKGLLEKALSYCRKKGFREVVIRTSAAMEQAIRLCRSAGFEQDGDWALGGVTLVRYHLKLS